MFAQRGGLGNLQPFLVLLLALLVLSALASGRGITIQSVYILVVLIVSIAVHEFSHAYMAYRLGDPTAASMGRLTLNPMAHLDPLGTIMMFYMVFLGAGFAWGKPVPVNPVNLRTNMRAGMAWVSFAGPASNFLLAALFAIPVRLYTLMPIPTAVAQFCYVGVWINIGLGLFNLIPLAPLDGSKVLVGILDHFRGEWAYRATNTLMSLEAAGPIVLILLIFLDSYVPILSGVLGPLSQLFFKVLVG